MFDQQFRLITLRSGESQLIPVDVEITEPAEDLVPINRLHLLAHIPWHTRYLQLIPAEYQDFYRFILPHLKNRTTNVHTAISVSFVATLHQHLAPQSNLKIAYLATMLHDSGWSKVSPNLIADSLDYSGIIFTPNAAEAKRQHTVYGQEVGPSLLRAYPGRFDLGDDEIDYIGDIARWHEQPDRYRPDQGWPPELMITCEADRLWPFSHQNFWLDTLRKGVDPVEYIENVKDCIDDLMLTDVGRHMAQTLYGKRAQEVEAYKAATARHRQTA